MSAAEPLTAQPLHLKSHFALFIVCVLLCMGLTALSNAATGGLVPAEILKMRDYFIRDLDEPYRAYIALGLHRGLLLGVGTATVYTFFVALIGRLRTGFVTAMRLACLLILGGVLFWLLGGATCLGMALLHPEWYLKYFYYASDKAPTDHVYLAAFADGAAWGVWTGISVSYIMGIVYYFITVRDKINAEKRP